MLKINSIFNFSLKLLKHTRTFESHLIKNFKCLSTLNLNHYQSDFLSSSSRGQNRIILVTRSKTTSPQDDSHLSDESIMQISDIFEEYPQLAEFDRSKIISFLEFMSIQGFNEHRSSQMLIRYPSILNSYTTKVPNFLGLWRKLGLTEKQQTKILFLHPSLIDFSPSKIRSRSYYLDNFFTRDEKIEVMLNSVNILTESEKIIESKLTYLLERACHSSRLLSKSKVFNYSFRHIVCRHEILIKAGFFKLIHYHKLHKQLFTTQPGIVREKYFSPHDIVCTSDPDFLKICTGNLLSLNELVAFEEITSEMGIENKEDNEEEMENDENEEESNSAHYFSPKDAASFYY